MPIITIYQGASGEGQELAETVAQLLGYRCVGREVLVEVSRRYRIPEAKLNEIVEKGPHWWERLLQDLERERARAERERERAAEAQVEAEKIEEYRGQSLEEVQQLQEELEAKGEEADRLREELEAERGKGFWRRLFGG